MAIDNPALIGYDNLPVRAPVPGAPRGHYDKKLYDACVDFEAIFVKQMLDSMRDTVEKNGLLDGGFAEGIYEDMLYEKYAETMAHSADFGIARLLYNQLAKPRV